jgi:hypothetical protein
MNIPKQSVPVSRDAIPSKALNQRGIAASVISFSADRFIDTQNSVTQVNLESAPAKEESSSSINYSVLQEIVIAGLDSSIEMV